MSTEQRLHVLLGGRRAGVLAWQPQRQRLSFTYEDGWRQSSDAYPLSLSMPLVAAEHPHAKIEPFLWGLLPDNQEILTRWAQRFQVSPRSPFALLANTGEDCPGAVQLVRPDRLESVHGPRGAGVEWIEEADIANRLRRLREDPSAGRLAQDTGQFSLGGAQPKTALLFQGGRWGVPSGRMPTTHILKPPIPGLAGHVENEHFCLALRVELDVPAASSTVHRFGDEIAIVVERYDRAVTRDLAERTSAEAAGLPADLQKARVAELRARARALQVLARAQPVPTHAGLDPSGAARHRDGGPASPGPRSAGQAAHPTSQALPGIVWAVRLRGARGADGRSRAGKRCRQHCGFAMPYGECRPGNPWARRVR